jgi:hypothetical protein
MQYEKEELEKAAIEMKDLLDSKGGDKYLNQFIEADPERLHDNLTPWHDQGKIAKLKIWPTFTIETVIPGEQNEHRNEDSSQSICTS